MSKRSSQQVSMKTVTSVLVAVGFLILFVFLLLQQANFLIGRSLLIAFGNGADSTYKGAWFAWNGDLVAKDFRLKPYGPDVDVTLKFDRVRVDTPGWAWVIGTLRSRKLVADTDRLHVTLDGSSSDPGEDPSLGDLGPFGTDTASPFEAEGCMRDTAWLRSELVDMGLSPGSTTLDFDYRVDGNKLESRITLETPGVSKVSLLRHEILPGEINPYLLDLTPTATTDERWLVEDAGFVKARNAFCAKRDGTTETEFVQRHVASVQRLLAMEGLALDGATLAAYAGFAANGGELGFGGSYAMPLPSDIYYEARETGAALTRMNGILERDKRKIAVQWSRMAPRPLPEYENLATYAAMVKEQGGVAGVGAVASADVAAPASLPATPAAAPAVSAAPAAPAAQAAAAPVASVATAGSVPAKLAPATAPAPPATAKRGDQLAWADLAKHVGHEVEITTVHTPMRMVTILAAAPNEVTVEGSVQGGHVKNRIHPDGFIRAVFIR